MKTIRILSRDAALTARLRRLLNGSLDLRPGDTLAQALEATAVGQADVLLVDFAAAEVDPDQLAVAASAAARPFLVGLLPPDAPVPPGADRCDLALARDVPDAALRMAIEQGLRTRRLELEVASLRRDRPRREAVTAPPAPAGPGSSAALGTVLKELGKLLAAHTSTSSESSSSSWTRSTSSCGPVAWRSSWPTTRAGSARGGSAGSIPISPSGCAWRAARVSPSGSSSTSASR